MARAHIPLAFTAATVMSIRPAGNSTVVVTGVPQGVMPELISPSDPVIFTDMELGPLHAMVMLFQPGFCGERVNPASAPGAMPPAPAETPSPCHKPPPEDFLCPRARIGLVLACGFSGIATHAGRQRQQQDGRGGEGQGTRCHDGSLAGNQDRWEAQAPQPSNKPPMALSSLPKSSGPRASFSNPSQRARARGRFPNRAQ